MVLIMKKVLWTRVVFLFVLLRGFLRSEVTPLIIEEIPLIVRVQSELDILVSFNSNEKIKYFYPVFVAAAAGLNINLVVFAFLEVSGALRIEDAKKFRELSMTLFEIRKSLAVGAWKGLYHEIITQISR